MVSKTNNNEAFSDQLKEPELSRLEERRTAIKTVLAGSSAVALGTVFSVSELSKAFIGPAVAQSASTIPSTTLLLLGPEPLSGSYTGTASVTDTVPADLPDIPTDVDVMATATVSLEVVSSTDSTAVVTVEAGIVIEGAPSPFSEPDVTLYSLENEVMIPVTGLSLVSEFPGCEELDMSLDIAINSNGLPTVTVQLTNTLSELEIGSVYTPSLITIPLASGESSLPTGFLDCGIDEDSTEVADDDDDAATDPPL